MSLQQRKRNFHIHTRQRKRKTKVSKITQKHTTHSVRSRASCRKKRERVSAVHLKSPLERRRSLREALWRRGPLSTITRHSSPYLNEKKLTLSLSERPQIFILSLSLYAFSTACCTVRLVLRRRSAPKESFILIAEN
jgi:hypothetical protein